MTQSQPHVYNDEFREKLAASTPRGIATVDEVVDLAMFLMSDAARSITGQTVTVDAGASL
jgi:enoyl-[acyl-carrier-protein] reductase (NADH)